MYSIFFEVLAGKQSKKDFFEMVDEIISPTEKIMIAKRIIIMYLLIKQIDHRTICQTLKVSTSTVAKFSLLLTKSTHTKNKLTLMVQKADIKLLFEELFASIFSPGSIGSNWKGAWQSKLEVERKKSYWILVLFRLIK